MSKLKLEGRNNRWTYGTSTFTGSYKDACDYFGVEIEEGRRNLYNIVIHHQLDSRTMTKMSNELYDKMMNAMTKPEYWTDPSDRNAKAIATLEKAYEDALIRDQEILDLAESKQRKATLTRVRFYKIWHSKCLYNGSPLYVGKIIIPEGV